MAIELNIDRPVKKETIEASLLIYRVREEKETEEGYEMLVENSKTGDTIVVVGDELLSDRYWDKDARAWAIAKKKEDGTYRIVDGPLTEEPASFFDYIIVKKGDYAPAKKYKVEVDIHPGRHLVPIPEPSDECMAVIDYWNAAAQARKVLYWDPEEEEVPGRFDEKRIGEKLFPYVKLGDVALKAVRMAVEEIYNFTFDRMMFRERLKENRETAPLANVSDVIDIAKLACIYLYEELCFENGNFTGLHKARDRLEAFPAKVMDYSKLAAGHGNIVVEAESMFLETRPGIAELCEKCFFDKRRALTVARKEQMEKYVEFFDSMPQEVNEIASALRPIYEKIGNYYRYLSDNRIRYEYRDYKGNVVVKYFTVPVPTFEELEGLKLIQRELKGKAFLILEKHGIKGTVPPFVEAESYVDPEEETRKKREWIEGRRKKFCKG